MSAPAVRDAFADLDAIYAELPRLACKRRCHRSCGPILMTRREWDRVQVATDQPNLTIFAIDGSVGPMPVSGLSCPLLGADNLCTVYASRPFICRLWGMVKALACPYGCVPERWLTDREASALMDRVTVVGQRPFGGAKQ